MANAAPLRWARHAAVTLHAIALVDNFLYPLLVGKRLRLHPLLVFIAVVGGISLFGAAGLVLGPVVLAVTEALLDVWRRRTATRWRSSSASRQRPSRARQRTRRQTKAQDPQVAVSFGRRWIPDHCEQS